MATNDFNLQVINSMTQTQMQSLKDANGKIPSLANQIIMTDEEDVNLSQLRTEVVYDMTSSNADKNWGYQGGILGGVTIADKNFSKYNKLIIHSYNLDNALTLIYDLEYDAPNTQSIAGLSYDNKVVMQLKCSVDSSRTSFTVNDIGYYNTSGYTNRNDNISYFVYKIEGILKQPAMIYTGAELHNGNGISIEDGVVGIVPAQAVALNTTRAGQNDTVVEYYMSSDGNTWYRKWASGWKECGGTVAGAANGGDTVTLPVTFSTLNFTTVITVSNAVGATGTGGYGGTFPGCNVVTYNKIRIDKNGNSAYPHCYRCCGF